MSTTSPQAPEDEFESRAMRQRTALTNPSPLLLRVRCHVVDHGGSGQAFDYAVNHYAAQRAADMDRDEETDR